MIFWLVQKATLLNETPLMHEDETINMKHFSAASHIFDDMLRCQSLPYKAGDMMEDDVLWFFLQLERAPMSSDDALYELSDQAKEVLRGKGVKERLKVVRHKVGQRRASEAMPVSPPGSSHSSSLSRDSSASSSSPPSHVPPHRPLHKSDPGTGSSDILGIFASLFSTLIADIFSLMKSTGHPSRLQVRAAR